MKHFVLVAVAVVALSVSVSSIGFTQAQPQTDTAFLTKAIEANNAEIEIARLAQTRSQNAEVRDFAKMIVQDHTQALDRLRNAMNHDMNTNLAKSKNSKMNGHVQLSKEQQQTVARLSKLTGAAFDRAFVDEMVKDHQKDIQAFEQEAGTTGSADTDADVDREKPGDGTPDPDHPMESHATGDNTEALARDLLPTLRSHLNQAEKLQQTLQH